MNLDKYSRGGGQRKKNQFVADVQRGSTCQKSLPYPGSTWTDAQKERVENLSATALHGNQLMRKPRKGVELTAAFRVLN